jgi:hypothetical protein
VIPFQMFLSALVAWLDREQREVIAFTPDTILR